MGDVIIDFYSKQSVYSDPGKYIYLFENLPDSIEGLCEVVRNLVIHQYDAKKIYEFDIPKSREQEPNTRYVSKILEIIIDLQNDKLVVPRLPEKRFVGLCRDFAILLCSILRNKGIPARLRVGFATYYEPNWNWDHWLCEYWNKKKERWVLVDTEVNKALRREYKIPSAFNSLDVGHNEYLLSGKAWQLCRLGKADPTKFGVLDIDISGLWFVRSNLLRDLASLNKVELLPWDYTDFLDKKFDEISELPEEEVVLLDNIADITTDKERGEEVISIYNSNLQLQVCGELTSYTPAGPIKVVI